MEYYPRIYDARNIAGSVPWVIEPVKRIAHASISGLMECRGIGNPMGAIVSEIPDTFYGKELVSLAFGTDEEVFLLSEKYGLLVSPFSDVMRRKYRADQALAATKRCIDQAARGNPSFNFELVEFGAIEEAIRIVEPVADEERNAIRDSMKLKKAQKECGGEVTGRVVALSEIRATAAALLDALKVVKAIANGASVSELSHQIKEEKLPNFPIRKLKYIEHCLSSSGLLGVSLTLEDELGGKVSDYESEAPDAAILGATGVEEIDALRQWNVLYDISKARPKELASLTEALALGIRNFALENRQWARCDKCGIDFPLTAGKMRKVSKPHGIYCSRSCRNAAAQKRHRESKKATGSPALKKNPE